jgi:predicted DNA binding CopG/RHH family protein
MSTRKIPQTDSIEELAQFWDTHDLTDFEDQLEEVPAPVFERQSMVHIPLPAKDVEAVKKLAKSQGLRYTDLLREWILEKVRAS